MIIPLRGGVAYLGVRLQAGPCAVLTSVAANRANVGGSDSVTMIKVVGFVARQVAGHLESASAVTAASKPWRKKGLLVVLHKRADRVRQA